MRSVVVVGVDVGVGTWKARSGCYRQNHFGVPLHGNDDGCDYCRWTTIWVTFGHCARRTPIESRIVAAVEAAVASQSLLVAVVVVGGCLRDGCC